MKLLEKFNKLVHNVVEVLDAWTDIQHQIGSEAEPALLGVCTVEKLPESDAPVKRVHLDGACLEPRKSYAFNKVSVTIDGDVPRGVSIIGNGGQLVVTGNVGDNASLSVTVPEYTHTETDRQHVLVFEGAMATPYFFEAEKEVEDGPKPPFNKDPVIIVQGRVGKNVSLRHSTGTAIKIQ